MTRTTEHLRRAAKALRRAHSEGDADARARVQAVLGTQGELSHARALHVIAREEGYESWPKLKFSLEAQAMDRAARIQRLRIALTHGQIWVIDKLLQDDPGLGRANFHLACATYDLDVIRETLTADPGAATRAVEGRRPIVSLAFSRYHQAGGSEEQSIEAAQLLVAAGADVNDALLYDGDPNSPLSVLYGALGHAQNLGLARWLLENGADPDDGESLYHATELGHARGLKLLLDHGADPAGTNALPRALDFNDAGMVGMLLAAGADPNEGIAEHSSGEPPHVIPALHQAARRMCDAEIARLLLEAGADPSARYKDVTPYAMARVYGNAAVARVIAEAGGDTRLNPQEALLAEAAEGPVEKGRFIDPAGLAPEFRDLIGNLVPYPERLEQMQRLLDLGLELDRGDVMGVTPVQAAGWQGLPRTMAVLLAHRPDLGHVNGYGGTLLSTIIHGSENCPQRDGRDHIGCARIALEQGVALPKPAIELAGDPDMAGFLADWAEAHPGQVVAEGIG